MNYIVIDKKTLKDITNNKHWIMSPDGSLEYVDSWGELCTAADAIAIEPSTYPTLISHKRQNEKEKHSCSNSNKEHQILIRCMSEHYVEFESPETFTQDEIEDIARKMGEQNKDIMDKYNPTICYNICNHTEYLYKVSDGESKNDIPDNSLSQDDFCEKYCKECGTQRCEGVGSDWFEGCHHKNKLKRE